MRIVVQVENNKITSIPKREYIRNFIYDSLRFSKWSFYHDKPKYKHFSFSNLFPFNADGLLDRDFNLIISSPYSEFIKHIHNVINETKSIQLGDTRFSINKIRLVNTPKELTKIQTATPIIVRLPKKLFDKYGIESQKEYSFWKETDVLNAFLELLLNNLKARYENFRMESEMLGFREKFEAIPDDLRIFSTLKYKKTVFEWDKHFTGTMWEFGITEKVKDSDIVRYMYEAALGERNSSSGSGFINIVKGTNVQNK